MTIDRRLYSTEQLIGVYYQLQPVPEFWLRFFPGLYTSDRENIEWSKITTYRHLAPLVIPTSQGRPTFKAEEEVYSFKPAYLKPKDTLQAAEMLHRRVGLGELGQLRPLSPQQRYDAAIAAVLQKHRTDIERRWEWMAAKAILDGQITLEDEAYDKTTVDFNRKASHTITLTGGARWGQAGVKPLVLIEQWSEMMAREDFGGPPTDVIMGPDAWTAFKADSEVLALLNTEIRNTSGTVLDIGIGNGSPVQFKGYISRNLRVWVYYDYYQSPTGTTVTYMDTKDVLLVGDNVRGVKAFGAILDRAANTRPEMVFSKMWDNEDPSATVILTQSAPLMIPINPNNTLKATVV